MFAHVVTDGFELGGGELAVKMCFAFAVYETDTMICPVKPMHAFHVCEILFLFLTQHIARGAKEACVLTDLLDRLQVALGLFDQNSQSEGN